MGTIQHFFIYNRATIFYFYILNKGLDQSTRNNIPLRQPSIYATFHNSPIEYIRMLFYLSKNNLKSIYSFFEHPLIIFSHCSLLVSRILSSTPSHEGSSDVWSKKVLKHTWADEDENRHSTGKEIHKRFACVFSNEIGCFLLLKHISVFERRTEWINSW